MSEPSAVLELNACSGGAGAHEVVVEGRDIIIFQTSAGSKMPDRVVKRPLACEGR